MITELINICHSSFVGALSYRITVQHSTVDYKIYTWNTTPSVLFITWTWHFSTWNNDSNSRIYLKKSRNYVKCLYLHPWRWPQLPLVKVFVHIFICRWRESIIDNSWGITWIILVTFDSSHQGTLSPRVIPEHPGSTYGFSNHRNWFATLTALEVTNYFSRS